MLPLLCPGGKVIGQALVPLPSLLRERPRCTQPFLGSPPEIESLVGNHSAALDRYNLTAQVVLGD